MRFLALVFLAGIALAAAVPLRSYDNDLEYASAVEDFFQDLAFEADDDIKTELGKKLKEHLDDILEKIKEAIDHGKGVKEDYLVKMKEIRQKLKDLKIDIGNKARELLDKVKDKAKDYWKRIVDILNPETRSLEHFEADDDIKTELGKKLKERFNEILEKVKDAIEQGKGVKEDTLEKLKELRQQLKDLKVDLGDKAKELLEKLKEKAKDYWQKILDKIAGKEKRDVAYAFNRAIVQKLKKLKEAILNKVDDSELEKMAETIFGKGVEMGEQLVNMLKNEGEGGKQRVLAWIERILDEDKETRSIKEVYDKVRDYFRDLHIELKEKFSKFGEYVKEKYNKGLEQGKGRVENLKKIAKKFLEDTKEMSRDVANEALEFFREYKEDLGHVFDDIKAKVKDIVKKDH